MAYLFLTLSVLVNGILIWFTYKLVKRSLSHMENVEFLIDDCDDFVRHLESIYELEMFYGEETLKGLLDHSKQLKEEINIFKENYLLELEDEEEIDGEESEIEEEKNTQDEG